MSVAGPVAGGRFTDGTLARSVERLHRSRPRLARVLVRLAARPALVLLPVAAVVGALAGALQPDGDEVRFRAAGLSMLGPGVLDVFSDSFLQIGPLYLLALGLLTVGASAVGLDAGATGVLSGAVHAVCLTALALHTAGRAASVRGMPAAPARWGVAGGLLATGHLGANLFMQHPEEILLGLLVALAAVEASAGRRHLGAFLLVVATGVKQWAVTTGALVVDRRSAGATVRTGLVVAAGLVLVYGPFALWGDVRTADIVWRFSPYSWVQSVPWFHDVSGWTFRVVQGALAGAAGLAVAWWGRGTPLLAAVVATGVRLLLDPLRHSYYAGGMAALLLVWLWSTPGPTRTRVAGTAVLLVPTLAPIVPTEVWWHLGTVGLVVMLVWSVRIEGRQQAVIS